MRVSKLSCSIQSDSNSKQNARNQAEDNVIKIDTDSKLTNVNLLARSN